MTGNGPYLHHLNQFGLRESPDYEGRERDTPEPAVFECEGMDGTVLNPKGYLITQCVNEILEIQKNWKSLTFWQIKYSILNSTNTQGSDGTIQIERIA